MANCMTCRHNDKAARYCPLMRAHTDLGYVLNCVAWAPTDKAEMRRIRTENAKLRELIRLMQTCIEHACMCDFCPLFVSEDMDEPTCIAEIDSRMRELGVEVP